MSYRDDVAALAARHAALDAEASSLAKQRDEAAQLLEEAKARAKLPILDNMRVASPCTQRWADMTGDDRVRHCASCAKDVYNLSGMTRDEAETLVRERNGQLCVRYFQRADGTILLGDCTIGKRRKRRRIVVAASLAAGLIGGIAIYKATRPAPPERLQDVAGSPMFEPPAHEEMMGEVQVITPPPPTTTR